MLDIRDRTPFSSTLIPGLGIEGYNYAVIVTRASYWIDAAQNLLQLAEEQPSPVLTDCHYGEPESSSVEIEADTALYKASTDLVVNGMVYAPGQKAATQVLASVNIGGRESRLLVTGDRHWQKQGSSWAASSPEPFQSMPLVYENAYGGRGSEVTGNKADYCSTNPVGKGFIPEEKGQPVVGLPLPNIEDPNQLIERWTDRPQPAGWGFISRQWQPRVSLAGTYDVQWQQQRMPLLPLDFDPLYFNASHPGLRLPHFLKGGEPVSLRHLHPDGRRDFCLPVGKVLTKIYESGKTTLLESNMDTVLIQAETNAVHITWRASFRCAKNIQYINKIDVDWQS